MGSEMCIRDSLQCNLFFLGPKPRLHSLRRHDSRRSHQLHVQIGIHCTQANKLHTPTPFNTRNQRTSLFTGPFTLGLRQLSSLRMFQTLTRQTPESSKQCSMTHTQAKEKRSQHSSTQTTTMAANSIKNYLQTLPSLS